MPLSKVQKRLLDKYQIPEPLQIGIAGQLGKDGEPFLEGKPDFLEILSDELQKSENVLLIKRRELAAELKKIHGSYLNKPKQIEALEETIKEYWALATSLWQTADQVVNQPVDDFKVVVSKKHAIYAIRKGNLPILELIRWGKPELFALPNYPMMKKRITGCLGGLGGAFLGLIAGFFGGLQLGFTRYSGLAKFISLGYAILGIFTGWATGGIFGARFGFQTANAWLGCKFGAFAAYTNPLNEPKGTERRHAIELKREDILFNLEKK